MLSTRELLRLAVPSIAFAVLTNAYRSVDQYWIKDVSTEAQAAIGSSIFVLILLYGIFALVGGGAAPLVARYTGARDPEGRNRVLGAGTAGALLIAAVVTVVGSVFADGIARSLGLEGQTAIECGRYLRTLSLTIVPLVMTPFVDQAFISMGSARVPMILHGVSLALNAILTPVLIYSADLGIVGAALASNGSRLITTGIGFWILARQTGLRASDVRFSNEVRRIVGIGYPIAARVSLYAGVYVFLLRYTISPLGPHVNAAVGIGFSALEGFTWPTFHGVSLAVASFVGRALGAGEPERARAAIRKALPLSTALGMGAGLLFYFGGHALTGLFAADPAVHEAATNYAVALAFSQLFVSYEALGSGVLEGAGATRLVFFLQVPWNLARVPLAYWMAFTLGWQADGIWWAINLTTFAKAVGLYFAVRHGSWTRLEI